MAQSGSIKNIGLILIDLQNSFVYGLWKSFFGDQEVIKIKSSFDTCASLLTDLPSEMPVLFTQIPYHRVSDFNFYGNIGNIVTQRKYPCLIKPNTNIMEAIGIEDWMQKVIDQSISTVVIGGCVTTSCVRVSSTSLTRRYKNIPGAPRFVVDLNLCAARNENYIRRCSFCMDRYLQGASGFFCGKCEDFGSALESPVDRAVSDMKREGVTVVEEFDWSSVLQQR